MGVREAQYYQSEKERINCQLCPHSCKISPGGSGFCKIRTNRNGRLETKNYARISSIGLDPIEKKPLYHYYPGKNILSVGTVGCNFACEFCQNWQISKGEEAHTQLMGVDELLNLALRYYREEGNIGLAYTYSEPGVWFEFISELMPQIREVGLKNILVTNAFLQPEPWEDLLQWTDAVNIDLKGFTPEYYRRICHGELDPVLKNIKVAAERIHLELTTLIIPGENDEPRQLRELVKWIADLDPEIPLHLSRYYPNYKMVQPATPVETMMMAYQIAKEYLSYVYLGNLGVPNDTHCPNCGEVIVERQGYHVKVISGRKCLQCGRNIRLVTGE